MRGGFAIHVIGKAGGSLLPFSKIVQVVQVPARKHCTGQSGQQLVGGSSSWRLILAGDSWRHLPRGRSVEQTPGEPRLACLLPSSRSRSAVGWGGVEAGRRAGRTTFTQTLGWPSMFVRATSCLPAQYTLTARASAHRSVPGPAVGHSSTTFHHTFHKCCAVCRRVLRCLKPVCSYTLLKQNRELCEHVCPAPPWSKKYTAAGRRLPGKLHAVYLISSPFFHL